MVNYARYGSYYYTLWTTLHSGLKNVLKKTGLSAHAEDHYPISTAMDQLGELTINRNAKTSGGIKVFSRNSS